MEVRALIAWNMKRLRVGRALSQERLAADSGVDRAYVSEIERELVAVSVDVLDRLAATLGVPVAMLLTEPSDRTAPPSNLPKGRKPASERDR